MKGLSKSPAKTLFGEGQVVELATRFTDPGGVSPYTAQIDWGDGTVTSIESIELADGASVITTNHVYADNGSFDVGLTIIDANGVVTQSFSSVEITNRLPVLQTATAEIDALQNRAINQVVATFTDLGFDNPIAGTTETFSATIDWGDGGITAGTVVSTSGSAGVPSTGTVSGQHTYTAGGSFTATVTVTDDDGGKQTATFSVNVQNAAPTIETPGIVIGDEGSEIDFLVGFTDVGTTGSYAAIIDWGDGSRTPASVSSANGAGVITANHVYADNGNYDILVGLTDTSNSQVVTATTTAVIGNVAPTLIAESDFFVDQNAEFNVNVATLIDPGFDNLSTGTAESFDAVIDWGDGTSSEGTITITPGSAGVATTAVVAGTHIFTSDGVFTATVTVTDDDGGLATATFDVTVANRAPVIDSVNPIFADEGAAVSLSSSFIDDSSSGVFVAAIHWGDGTTSTATVVYADGQGIITGNHVYADNGGYAISIELTEVATGAVASTSTTATIANVAPTIRSFGNQTVLAGTPLTFDLGVFSDPAFSSLSAGTSETFTATIDWGDGTTATPELSVQPGGSGVATTGTISATHTFANQGTFVVTLTLMDDDGGTATAAFNVIVDPVLNDDSIWFPAIDFETDAVGNSLNPGDVLAEQWAAWGIHVTTQDPVNHPPLIFDSANPTGGDTDLGTPNQSFGGPGVGSGGGVYSPFPNEIAQNNILIISEDADTSDPDDDIDGGTLILTFDNPVQLDEIGLLDLDRREAYVRLYDAAGNLLRQQEVHGRGNNSHQTVVLDAAGVSRLEIVLTGTGALTELIFDRDSQTDTREPLEPPVTKFITVDGRSDRAFQYDAEGNLLENFDLVGGATVRGVTTTPTGNPVWVLRSNENVYVYDRQADTFLGQWDAVQLRSGRGIASDGQDVWIVDSIYDRVYFYEGAADWTGGRRIATSSFSLRRRNYNPSGLAVFGDRIWVSDASSDRVFVYNTDGDPLGNFRLDRANSRSSGITTDATGRHLWVSDYNDGAIYYYENGTNVLSGSLSATSIIPLAPNNQRPGGIADPAVSINLGEPVVATIAATGEVDEFAFSAAAGQSVFVDITSLAGGQLNVDLVAPDGSSVFIQNSAPGTVNDTGPLLLDQTGTYVLVAQGVSGDTPTYEFTIHSVVDDVVSINLGESISGGIDTPGARNVFEFNATGGQNGFLDITSVTGGVLDIQLLAPDGSIVVESLGGPSQNPDRGPFSLDQTGTYSVVIDGRGDDTPTFGLTLHEVFVDIETISFGTVVAGAIQTPGSVDRWELNVAAGQRGFFDFNSLVGGTTDIQLIAPDRSIVFSDASGLARLLDNGPVLFEQTGIYTLTVEGRGVATPTYEFVVHDVTVPQQTTLEFDSPTAVNVDTPGGSHILELDSQAGGQLLLDFSDLAGGFDITVEAPDGQILYSRLHSFNFSTGLLDASQQGAYTITIDPRGDGVTSFVVDAISVPAPVVQTIALGDIVTDMIDASFITDVFEFDAVAGQRTLLDFQSVDAPLRWTVFAPDGSRVDRSLFSSRLSNLNLDAFTFDQSGTYQIVIEGQQSATPAYQFELLDIPVPDVRPLALGEITSGSIDSPASLDILEFSGVAGQNLYLDVSSVDDQAGFRLLGPDGSVVISTLVDSVTRNLDRLSILLPDTGTYQLEVRGDRLGTPEYEFVLDNVPNPDVQAIELDEIYIGSIEVLASVDLWTFNGTAGQQVFIDIQRTEDTLQFDLLAPDGTSIGNGVDFFTRSLDTGPITLPADGEYTFQVQQGLSQFPDSYQFSINDVTPDPPVTIDFNTPVPGVIDLAGEIQIYEFDAVTGQALTIDELQRDDGIGFTLVSPTGNELFADTTGDQTIVSLAESGTYTLTVDDTNSLNRSDATGQFSFQLIASQTTPDAPAAANLTVSNVVADRVIIGDPATVEIFWTVINNGTEPAIASVDDPMIDRVVFSPVETFGTFDDRIFATFERTESLAPGESYQGSATIELSEGFEGSFFIYVVSDATNVVNEGLDTGDNVARSESFTTIYRTQRPDSDGAPIAIVPADGSRFVEGTDMN